MKWNKFRLKTTTEAEDIVSSMLADLGIEGVEIEDKIPLTESDKEQMFVDILPEIEADDGVAYLSFYLEEDEDKEKVLANVKKELEEMSAYVNVGACEIEESQTEDVDWVNNWKKYFHPLEVGEKILIKPEWEELKDNTDRIVFNINPGMSFGTGGHYTTQLCIETLEKYIKPGVKVLDLGCGSGILSIISLLLGADSAFAVDIDPNAVDIAYQNAGMNDVDISKYTVKAGDIITNTELQNEIAKNEYDVVVANIVADVIIALAPKAREYMKKGGVFITSGIIEDRVDDVKAALEKCGFEINSIKQRKDWVSIVCK